MTKNSIAIIGENRLAQELLALSREKGFEARLSADANGVSSSTPIVVDTLVGNQERKRSALAGLDAILAPASVIVSSCLDCACTQLGAWTRRPERLVGFATFFPVKDRNIVEIAAGLRSAESSLAAAEQLFAALGKDTVRVKDAAGLIFPRILSLIINEAARSLEERVAQAEAIDIAMRLGTNYPQGPLRWADQIGLDEILAVLEGLQRETGDDRYRPAPLLRKLVLAGWLGEASGRGFYDHGEGKVSQ